MRGWSPLSLPKISQIEPGNPFQEPLAYEAKEPNLQGRGDSRQPPSVSEMKSDPSAHFWWNLCLGWEGIAQVRDLLDSFSQPFSRELKVLTWSFRHFPLSTPLATSLGCPLLYTCPLSARVLEWSFQSSGENAIYPFCLGLCGSIRGVHPAPALPTPRQLLLDTSRHHSTFTYCVIHSLVHSAST